MAFACVRTKNFLMSYLDDGERIINLTMARCMRDRDEIRRWGLVGPIAVVHATVDMVEAISFVIAAIVVLITSRAESPNLPIRFWIVGFALQCVAHVAWFCMQRCRRRIFVHFLRNYNNTVKNLESAKEAIYIFWWMLGCLFMVQSSKNGWEKSAPQLLGLAAIFLLFDIFLFCAVILMVMLFGVVLLCLIPLLYVFFYILGEQVYDDLPQCPFCKCSVHKVSIRFV